MQANIAQRDVNAIAQEWIPVSQPSSASVSATQPAHVSPTCRLVGTSRLKRVPLLHPQGQPPLQMEVRKDPCQGQSAKSLPIQDCIGSRRGAGCRPTIVRIREAVYECASTMLGSRNRTPVCA